jgi:hypothetical protein
MGDDVSRTNKGITNATISTATQKYWYITFSFTWYELQIFCFFFKLLDMCGSY